MLKVFKLRKYVYGLIYSLLETDNLVISVCVSDFLKSEAKFSLCLPQRHNEVPKCISTHC
jgi:hypothetical protein